MATTPNVDVMPVNTQANKCLTIAEGISTDNNVTALQFTCDSDPSRRWRIIDVGGSGVYEIKNLQTNNCLEIAGGRCVENNVEALQYACDGDLSRSWLIRASLSCIVHSAGSPFTDVLRIEAAKRADGGATHP